MRSEDVPASKLWSLNEATEAMLGRWQEGPALLGKGTFETGDRVRLGLLGLGHDAPSMRWSGLVAREDIEGLRGQLRRERGAHALREGRIDFMFATPWNVAWSERPVPTVWSREGITLRVTGDHLEICSASMRRIPRGVIAGIEAEGRAFHARTAVWMQTRDGRRECLVQVFDEAALVLDDPWEIYETWPHEVAKTLACALEVPVLPGMSEGPATAH